MRRIIATVGSLAVLATSGFYTTSAAFAADAAAPSADELTSRPWFVKQDGEWFKYAKHNWQEQRREASYQFARTVERGGYVEEARYEIVRPYYTVEHKQVRANGDADVLAWLEKIGAQDVGGGWWAIPDSVIAAVDFNPLTVADTGTVRLTSYGGPNVTVEYRKTQELTFDEPDGKYYLTQHDQLYWNGSRWVSGRDNAVWVTEAPAGGVRFDSRTVPDPDDPPRTETLYATKDGETTNQDDAAWLTKAPEGGGWKQIGEPTYPEWNDDDPWYQVEGYDWALGKDPTASTPDGQAQPDYYPGYNAETQRFRPVIKMWKLRLPSDVDAPPSTEPPPASETPPTVVVPKEEPIRQANKEPADPGEVLRVLPEEASRLPAKDGDVLRPAGEAVRESMRPRATREPAVVPTSIDAGL